MADFEGPRRGSALAWLAACAVTAVILGFGAALGLWFLPFVAGVAAGIAPGFSPISIVSGLALTAGQFVRALPLGSPVAAKLAQ